MKRFLLILAVTAALFSAVFIYRKSSEIPVGTDGLYVHFIDVGQGDCELVICGDKTMLIDCGEESQAARVISYLRNLHIKKLDYIIATHPHSDHMGGMYRIIENFYVDEIYFPDVPNKDIPTQQFFMKFLDACDTYGVKLKQAKIGGKISLGDAKAKFIAPCRNQYENMNDYSAAVILKYGKTSFFMGGDAENESENDMLMSGKLEKVNVYKASHHGSDSSGSKDFLNVLKPDAVVISCGADNPYGHPSAKALRRIKKHTDNIYRTDICGDITAYSDGNEISFTFQRESR